MNLDYTAEQKALKESASRFLTDRYGLDFRRRIQANADGYSLDIWHAFANLGWLGLPFAETDGGLDGSMVDVALMAEAFGAALVAEPYLSTVVLCGGLIAGASGDAGRAALIPRIIAGKAILAFAHNEPEGRHDYGRVAARATRFGDGWRINGCKRIVLDAPLADYILVSAQGTATGLGLFLVPRDAPGMVITPFPIVDGRRAGDILLNDVHVAADARIGGDQDQTPAIDAAIDRAATVQAADAIGAMQMLFDKTIEHTKTRLQFGQPLAANQVVKHRLVDMAVRIEEARSIALRAAIRIDDGSFPAIRGQAASAAKVKVAAAARYVAEQAVQLHGGMGVTDELDIGAYFKRIMAIEASYGTPTWHLKRYAALRNATVTA